MPQPTRKSKKDIPLENFGVPFTGFGIPAGHVLEGGAIKPREAPEERRHRLRKEDREFWVKEAPTYVLAVLVLSLTSAYCFWVLWRRDTPREDRQWVMSILTSLVVGIIGYLFGKVTK